MQMGLKSVRSGMCIVPIVYASQAIATGTGKQTDYIVSYARHFARNSVKNKVA